MKYLVYSTEHFYDGHGEEADGKDSWFMANEEDGYHKLDHNLRYNEELVQDDELYEQDGYHTRAYSFDVVRLENAMDIELAQHYLDNIAYYYEMLSKLHAENA